MINRGSCKYEVVVEAARAMGWRIGDMGEEFNLLWADSYVPADTVSALNKYQKVAASTPPRLHRIGSQPLPHIFPKHISTTHISTTHGCR